jgi:hypothetical protein
LLNFFGVCSAAVNFFQAFLTSLATTLLRVY